MAKTKFKTAVNETTEIKDCYYPGLQALKHSDKSTITLEDSRLCEGSVNIDNCVKALYPQDNRWDYTIGYAGKAYFAEVHPANTSEVRVLIGKADWLNKWLQQKAPKLKAIKAKAPLYWIASGKYNIPEGTPQARMLSQSGIRVVSKLVLRSAGG